MIEDMVVYRCLSCGLLFHNDVPVCHDFEYYCNLGGPTTPRIKDPQYNVIESPDEYYCTYEV